MEAEVNNMLNEMQSSKRKDGTTEYLIPTANKGKGQWLPKEFLKNHIENLWLKKEKEWEKSKKFLPKNPDDIDDIELYNQLEDKRMLSSERSPDFFDMGDGTYIPPSTETFTGMKTPKKELITESDMSIDKAWDDLVKEADKKVKPVSYNEGLDITAEELLPKGKAPPMNSFYTDFLSQEPPDEVIKPIVKRNIKLAIDLENKAKDEVLPLPKRENLVTDNRGFLHSLFKTAQFFSRGASTANYGMNPSKLVLDQIEQQYEWDKEQYTEAGKYYDMIAKKIGVEKAKQDYKMQALNYLIKMEDYKFQKEIEPQKKEMARLNLEKLKITIDNMKQKNMEDLYQQEYNKARTALIEQQTINARNKVEDQIKILKEKERISTERDERERLANEERMKKGLPPIFSNPIQALQYQNQQARLEKTQEQTKTLVQQKQARVRMGDEDVVINFNSKESRKNIADGTLTNWKKRMRDVYTLYSFANEYSASKNLLGPFAAKLPLPKQQEAKTISRGLVGLTRKELIGTGAVSDWEQRILAQYVSVLDFFQLSSGEAKRKTRQLGIDYLTKFKAEVLANTPPGDEGSRRLIEEIDYTLNKFRGLSE